MARRTVAEPEDAVKIEGITEVVVISRTAKGVEVEYHFPVKKDDKAWCSTSEEYIPGKEIPLHEHVTYYEMDVLHKMNIEILLELRNDEENHVMWFAPTVRYRA